MSLSMLKRIKNIFIKEEKPEMPFIRAIIVFTENALEEGRKDDLNKMIVVYHGNEIFKEMSFSKSRLKILQEVEHIPVYDFTQEEKYQEGEEIIPTEVHYEQKF